MANREIRVRKVRPLPGLGPVVSFEVVGAATYFCEDVLSHNAKIQG